MLLGKEVIVFDGGMGSELTRRGLTGIPEELNITAPEEIKAIHRAYSAADVITTNTFGLNRIKYRGGYDIAALARAAIVNARSAGKKVFFDVGPTGRMTEPIGDLGFDEAYEAYKEVALVTRGLVDGYIVETFSDVYELKACVLALKENADAPVFATATFDAGGRTLTGSTPEIVAAVLEGLGVEALGVNCSLGPKELLPIVKRLLAATDLPIIVQPNCGLPVLENGKTRYTLGIDEFDEYIAMFVELGVAAVGGCCGTTPEFIERIAKYSGRPVKSRTAGAGTVITSSTRAVDITGVKVCGERLNPTGKRAMKEALAAGNLDYLADEAARQKEAGADILDLNVGVPGIDEPAVMREAVRKVQEFVDLPLQIDSSDPAAVEAGVRYYNGVPLINSVNGEARVMDRIFPIVKKYGAVVLGLCMDERGVPRTARERYEIAKRIVERAESAGIPRRRIMIDTLVLTASAEQELVRETVEALRLVSALGVKTALGVSNVSFGLPNRPLINRTFLALAMGAGLNMPIMNPLDGEMMGAVRAFEVLYALDGGAEKYIELYKDYAAGTAAPLAAGAGEKNAAVNSLFDCVKRGVKGRAEEFARRELEKSEPMTVINDVLIRALGEVGRDYEAGRLFLPQLVSSAEAAKVAFGVVSAKIPQGGAKKARVMLATVKGDVHDIGKNICKVVLESYGYEVIDLGKDVPVERVLDANMRYTPYAIGLSALMTTTVASMRDTIAALRKHKCPAVIFVGGAVLNAEIARDIGADYYTPDALSFVKKLESLLGK